MRPSIARFLKKQIGGFVREYEREVHRESEQPKTPASEKASATPPEPTDKPARPE